jgi:hypothetical protein
VFSFPLHVHSIFIETSDIIFLLLSPLSCIVVKEAPGSSPASKSFLLCWQTRHKYHHISHISCHCRHQFRSLAGCEMGGPYDLTDASFIAKQLSNSLQHTHYSLSPLAGSPYLLSAPLLALPNTSFANTSAEPPLHRKSLGRICNFCGVLRPLAVLAQKSILGLFNAPPN